LPKPRLRTNNRFCTINNIINYTKQNLYKKSTIIKNEEMKSKTLVTLIVLASLVMVSLNIPISKPICFNDPIPDLECYGELRLNPKLGSTSYDSFTVENVGDPGSELDWSIDVWPAIGNWNFDPWEGYGLKPEDGEVTVEVTFTAPTDDNTEFEEEMQVTIYNKQNSDDRFTIYATWERGKDQSINQIFYQFLGRILQYFPLLSRLLSFQ